MAKYVVLILMIGQLVCLGSEPATDGFGIGIILGEPTGISFKYWLKRNTAIDGAVAWSFEGEDSFHLHGDYLFHNDKWVKVDEGKILVYYGLGCRIRLQDHGRLGIRIPFGATYLLKDAPLDFFLEIVPIMDLIPDTELEFNGGFGVRFFF